MKPTPTDVEKYLDDLIADIVRDVAELPDRTSPQDEPEMMLVSAKELTEILKKRL